MKSRRIDLIKAAEPIITALKPLCERVEIVGSIRRRESRVGDLDILCKPFYDFEGSLFGSTTSGTMLPQTDSINWNHIPGVRNVSGGMRMKKGMLRTITGDVKFQIFFCLPPAQWGVLCFIRTGPAWLSRAAVSSYEHTDSGILPARYQVKDGALMMRQTGVVINTPDEEDFMYRLHIDKKYYNIKKRSLITERRNDVQ